jgi:cytochrome P450 PksS
VTGRSFWFLTRYDDVVTALRDSRLGREVGKVPDEVRAQHEFDTDQMFDMVNQHMLNYDPPIHSRLRRLVSHAFTPKRIRDLGPRIEDITAELIDGVGDAFDLIDDVAAPLPIAVIAELLGVPIEDHEQFRWMVDAMLRPTDGQSGITAAMSLLQYVNEAIELRRTRPGDDLLSALIHLEEQGDRLSHAELISTVQLLLIAGHETTVNLIGNGMIELMTHPESQAALIANSDLLDPAIEEMLRYHGPVETPFPRFAYEDVEIGGQTIKAGDQVVPVLLGANRDPAHFDDPDRFDVTRDPNRHVAFGFGAHYCLGAPLARLEARIAIGKLLERWPTLRLGIDRAELEWHPDFFLRGARSIPVAGG